jgi:hypothetical protein
MGTISHDHKDLSNLHESSPTEDIEASKPINTVAALHDDEGVTVVNEYTGEKEWTSDEEKKVVRKIDLRLLTLLTASYGLQFYDKTMMGQAVRALSCFSTASRSNAC